MRRLQLGSRLKIFKGSPPAFVFGQVYPASALLMVRTSNANLWASNYNQFGVNSSSKLAQPRSAITPNQPYCDWASSFPVRSPLNEFGCHCRVRAICLRCRFHPRSASPNPGIPPRGKGEHEVQRKPLFRTSPLYLLTSWVPHTEFSVWPLTEVDGSPSSITPAPPAPCRRRRPNNPKMRIRRHKNFSKAPLQSSSPCRYTRGRSRT